MGSIRYGSVITHRGRSGGGRRRKAGSRLPVLLAFLLLLAGVAPAVAARPAAVPHVPSSRIAYAAAPAVAITTTSPLTAAKIGVAYSKTLVATGGGPYSWSLTVGTLPTGLNLNAATGVISGTPTVGGSKTFTVKVVGAGGASATKQFTLNVTTVWVTTTALPNGVVNALYSATLAAGGTGPFTWSIVAGSGTLPTGLTLNGSTGVISGKPTAVGKKAFKVKVVGAGGKSATKALSITIQAAGTISITTTSLPAGTVGTAYSSTLTAAGTGPFTWSLASGSLPAGLTLTPATGTISGTPTAAGTSSFTAKVVGAGGASATKALSIVISASTGTVAISTTSLPAGTIGSTYAATLTATGTGPFTWSLASGTLPAGLILDAATGAITGTPTAAGTSSFTAKVVGAGGSSATKALSIVVTAPALTITTSSLPDGTVGSAYAATLAASGTGPFTWSVTTGTLPAGLTLNPSTGAITGTPTAAGTSNFTVQVAGSGGSTATKALTIVIAALPSMENWTQGTHDAGHTGWAPGETVITTAKAASVHQEWSVTEGPTVIDGGKLYTIAKPTTAPETLTVLAYDLAGGTIASSRALTMTECSGATEIATTATQIIANCGNNILAFDKAAPHAIEWQTSDTDPGQSLRTILITGTLVVAETYAGAVLAYRLTDGTRMWQALLPSGAGGVNDVAATSTTVVVAYNDRIRGLSLATGAQTWVATGVTTSNLVIGPDGWVYTNKGSGIARYNAATGAAGWAVRPGTDIYRIAGADNDTVYVWEAFFNFGPPSPSNLHALRTTDGSVKWTYAVPSRLGSFAITGGVIWLTSSEIYSQGQASDLIAVNRATGAELKRIGFVDNMYGSQPAAFGNGKIALQQGGSAGGTTPHRTLVYGLAPPSPTIETTVLPMARPGQAYTATLSASAGTAPYTWALASGTLPSGVTLSGSGTIAGTTSATGTFSVTVRVTDSKGGATRTGALVLGVIATGTASWNAPLGGPDNNAFEPAETSIGLGTAPSLGYRFTLAQPSVTSVLGYREQPLVVGNRAYVVGPDGLLRAWDTTGTTTNRPALWAKGSDPADPARHFGSNPSLSYSNGTLVAVDDMSRLVAVRASDGAILWRTDSALLQVVPGRTLADTSRVFVLDYAGIVAVSLTSGSVLWRAPLPGYYGTFVTDGTRVYVTGKCTVKALDVSTGTEVWAGSALFPDDDPNNCQYTSPLVLDQGTLHFRTGSAFGALRASDGVLLWSRSEQFPGVPVAVGGVLYSANGYASFGAVMRAYDAKSGDVLWSRDTSLQGVTLSIAGDLVVAVSHYYTSNIYGFDRTTGDMVWDGGLITSGGTAWGGASVAGGRLYVHSLEKGVRVYAPPV